VRVGALNLTCIQSFLGVFVLHQNWCAAETGFDVALCARDSQVVQSPDPNPSSVWFSVYSEEIGHRMNRYE